MTEGTFIPLGTHDTPGLRARRVQAFVPAGPAPIEVRPLLVLFDGQNVFGDAGSFAGGWHAHEAAMKLARRKSIIAPVLLAIDHGGEQRLDELSAWKMKENGGGRADLFLEWLVKLLLPKVRNELGATQNPARTFVGGSSMGGLASLYAHFRHPETFGGALCMSSSFFVGDRAALRYISERPRPRFSRIYLDAGEKEAGGRLAALTREAAARLEARGYSQENLKLRIDKRGTHSERHWKKRLPGALRFLLAQEAGPARAPRGALRPLAGRSHSRLP